MAQLTRHVARLPHFAGIAIDRSDMMEFYNLDGDDGVSAVHGMSARSLFSSCKGLDTPFTRTPRGLACVRALASATRP